jgi:hypothetical protein
MQWEQRPQKTTYEMLSIVTSYAHLLANSSQHMPLNTILLLVTDVGVKWCSMEGKLVSLCSLIAKHATHVLYQHCQLAQPKLQVSVNCQGINGLWPFVEIVDKGVFN